MLYIKLPHLHPAVGPVPTFGAFFKGTASKFEVPFTASPVQVQKHRLSIRDASKHSS